MKAWKTLGMDRMVLRCTENIMLWAWKVINGLEKSRLLLKRIASVTDFSLISATCIFFEPKYTSSPKPQKDSVSLLEDYLRYMRCGAVFPVRNQYFGDADDFALYTRYLNGSEILASRITETLNFPALADVIADAFYTGGRTIPETAENLSAFAAQSLLSWQNQVHGVFETAEAIRKNTHDAHERDFE